jgi:tetratricopeptide (TPR) repeat protein
MARLGQLETLFDMGRWDEVLMLAQSIKGWLKPRDQGTEAAVYATIFEGWVHLRRGEIEDLGDLAEELLVQAIPFEASEYVAPAALLAAEYRRITGDEAGAREGMRTFLEVTQGSPNFRALFVPVAVRSLVALGDVDAAEAVIPAKSDARTARHRVSLLTAHAVVAEARGRCEDALEGYREAIELWRSHGFRLELGLTLTGAARCLLELDREGEAEPMLLEAREVLAPLRAGPSVTEVEAMLNAEAAELG